MKVSEARQQLMSRTQLLGDRMTERQLARAVAEGELKRVDHGLYVSGDAWRAVYSQGRHLLRVVAADERRGAGEGVASHVSAAVLHQLPLLRVEPGRVHVSGIHTAGLVSARTVARHQVLVRDEDVVVIDGIPATSLARTVADVIRVESVATGLAVADAAMRQVAWDASTRTYSADAADVFRAEVAGRLPAGGRGVRRARRVIELADGRAENPGKSLSRLYLLELGFDRPRLQVKVPGPNGGHFFVDFGLDDVGAFGEFDGVAKYTDPIYLAGRTPEQVLLAEKQREDWIRGTTNRRYPRWGWEHLRSAEALGIRLSSFHVHAPARK